MAMLLLGLVLFLGVHSLRLLAPDWRERQIRAHGAMPFKGLYALASLAGLLLVVWGFGLARNLPVPLYAPPPGLRHANSLFTLAAFVLVVAAYVPRNHLKARLGHPMTLGVALWAFGHLLATGMLHDVVLFGAFLAWAGPLYVVSVRRDRRAARPWPAGTAVGDALVVTLGVAGWAAFAFWLHLRLIGVSPLG